MEATELRKSNLLYFPFHDENVEVIGLPLLENNKQGIQVLTKGSQLCEELGEQFKPIKITEEWLLKMGFVDANYYFTLKAKRKEIKAMWTTRVVSSGVRSNFYIYKYGHIKYVHQLQNLYFALTGEELKITK